MTKKIVICPICKTQLGKFHSVDADEITSKHIILKHSQVAKYLVEIGLRIEEYQKEFKIVSGMYFSQAQYNFVNQNTMRSLGWTEKEINKHLKGE